MMSCMTSGMASVYVNSDLARSSMLLVVMWCQPMRCEGDNRSLQHEPNVVQ